MCCGRVRLSRCGEVGYEGEANFQESLRYYRKPEFRGKFPTISTVSIFRPHISGISCVYAVRGPVRMAAELLKPLALELIYWHIVYYNRRLIAATHRRASVKRMLIALKAIILIAVCHRASIQFHNRIRCSFSPHFIIVALERAR